MNRVMTSMPARAAGCLALLLSLALFGCGGGGGSAGPAQQAGAPAADATGTLKVLFGDGPVDDFDRVELAVREIRLIGDDGDADGLLVVADPATIDLLQLRNVSELLVDAEVAAGTYSKIRLVVESLDLVRLDDQGLEIERIPVRLPGNGKVDLNPQGDFVLGAGDELVVEVDVDLDRSIHIVQTGNGGYRFRPVVFVNILDAAADGRWTRLFGVMDMIDAAEGTLLLCDTELVASDDDVPSDDCKPIRLTDDALVLDAEGNPAALDTLSGSATVLARFRYGIEAADSYYEAVLLAAGDEDAFERRFGSVTESAAGGTFGFLDDDADAAIEVALLDTGDAAAVVIGADHRRTTADAIVAGLDAEVWGRERALDGGGSVFEAFLVHLRGNPDDLLTVAGTLTVLNLETDRLTVATADGDRCVQLTPETAFFQIDDTDELAEIGAIDLADLLAGLPIEASGAEIDADGCLVAVDVIVER